jgi:hypothetical protein
MIAIHRKLMTFLVFATTNLDFANPPTRILRPIPRNNRKRKAANPPQTRETPRERQPKRSPSRGSLSSGTPDPEGRVSRRKTVATSQWLPVRLWSCPLSGTLKRNGGNLVLQPIWLSRFRGPWKRFRGLVARLRPRMPFMSFPSSIVAS